MTLENKRLDVTDRITGKLNGSGFQLYLETDPIGQVMFTNTGNQFELKPGFEQEGTRIYQQVSVPSNSDMKYVDCDDENGWC